MRDIERGWEGERALSVGLISVVMKTVEVEVLCRCNDKRSNERCEFEKRCAISKAALI
jgi:hypothetical protein